MEQQDGKFVAMVTKDLQTLNLKFDQVMFNSLVPTWERNFEEILYKQAMQRLQLIPLNFAINDNPTNEVITFAYSNI